ncbi:hypothetical protein H6G27_35680 [Nostoc linckia FACHB-104]|nr:hypothetical protein [Nostoc linckia FACHB-104]
MVNQDSNNKLTKEQFYKKLEEGQRLFQDIDLTGVDLSRIEINKPPNISAGKFRIHLKQGNIH